MQGTSSPGPFSFRDAQAMGKVDGGQSRVAGEGESTLIRYGVAQRLRLPFSRRCGAERYLRIVLTAPSEGEGAGG